MDGSSRRPCKVALARLSAIMAAGILAVPPVWCQSPDAVPGEKSLGDVVSLRVAGREVTRGPHGRMEAVYRLVNDSPKTIVAWEFRCVAALQRGGRGLHGGIGSDSYFDYERSRHEPHSTPTELIESGQTFEQRITFSAKEVDGPMAGKTCGPVAVIFADTSYEGLETLATFWFSKRAQTAVDARVAYRALENRLGSGELLVEALGALAAELARPVNQEKGIGFGADTFAVSREQILRGQPISADQILAGLEFRFQAAMKHLPEAWQKKVMAEVTGFQELPSF